MSEIIYIEKTMPSGAKIRMPDPSQFPAVEPEAQETLEQKLARIEETQDLLLMMMLEQEGII